MKSPDLKSMSVNELWSQRLRQLDLGNAPHNVKRMGHARRPYPQVFPKYRNPAEPSETWTGRGKQPRWLTAQLKSGKQLEDFRIQASSDRGAALRKVVTLINEKTSRGWSNIKKIGFLKRNQRI